VFTKAGPLTETVIDSAADAVELFCFTQIVAAGLVPEVDLVATTVLSAVAIVPEPPSETILNPFRNVVVELEAEVVSLAVTVTVQVTEGPADASAPDPTFLASLVTVTV